MMNDTMTPHSTEPRLVRPRDDRVIAGVASGLARRFGIEPAWIRIGFVVASFFGGLGVLMYLIGWLAIPEEGSPDSPAERFVGDLDDSTAWVGGALIVVAAMIVLGATNLVRGELILAAGLFIGGLILYRGTGRSRSAAGRPEPPPVGGPPPPPQAAGIPSTPGTAPGETAEEQMTHDDTDHLITGGGDDVPPPSVTLPILNREPPPPPPPPAEPASYLGRIAIACMLVALGTIALLDNLDVISPDLHHYVASVVLISGLGLLVGSVAGRARGLIAIGLLAMPLLVVSSVIRVPFAGEWGDRTYRPETAVDVAPEYDHGMGRLVVDLREITPLENDLDVDVDLGIGEVLMLVPEDLSLDVAAEAGIGQITLLGAETNGFAIEDRYTSIEEGEPVLDLTIDLGIGQVRVAHDR